MAEDETPADAPPPALAKPPINRLHEWLAALVLMIVLAGILWVFLNFLRAMRL